MNILLTGAFEYSSEQIKAIKALGFTVVFLQNEESKVEQPEIYDVVVCNNLFKTNDISLFKNLKYIQITSAGLDRLPLDYIYNHNIILNNAKNVYSIPISEFVVMQILNVYKNNFNIYNNVSKQKWLKERSCRELSESKVAILGCGSIGIEVAKRLKAFGCAITGFDIYDSNNSAFDFIFDVKSLKSLVNTFDILVVTCPLNENTFHFIDKVFLDEINKEFVLVNVSRGQIIDEFSLVNKLKTSSHFYAILDVFEQEPLSDDNELWTLRNVTISPHNSFVSNLNNKRLFDVIYKFLKGVIK